MMASPFT